MTTFRMGDRVRVRRHYPNGELFGWVHGYVRRLDEAFTQPTICVILREFEDIDGTRRELCGHGWYSVAAAEKEE